MKYTNFAFIVNNPRSIRTSTVLAINSADPEKESKRLEKILDGLSDSKLADRIRPQLTRAESLSVLVGDERAVLPNKSLSASLRRLIAEVEADKATTPTAKKALLDTLQNSFNAQTHELHLVDGLPSELRDVGRLTPKQVAELERVTARADGAARPEGPPVVKPRQFSAIKSGDQIKLDMLPGEAIKVTLRVQHDGPTAFEIDQQAEVSAGHFEHIGGFGLILRAPSEHSHDQGNEF